MVPDALARELRLLVRRAQSERRPSVAAALVRDGESAWSEAAGLADVARGEAATTDHQYRIGSITKTFTAAAVMQLRDAGALGLDDPVEAHVPVSTHGRLTLRGLLAHTSGLQREPAGAVWETLQFPSGAEALAGLAEAEQVLRFGERWHYSNLAYVLLGEVVERRGGVPFERYVEERLLAPLGLGRTTFGPRAPFAQGYFVDPWSDVPRPEPHVRTTGTAAALGELWSTPVDLARWAAFLAEPDPAVLSKESVDEMARVHAIADHERWTQAHGAGLQLFRDGDRVLAGHGGAMPGFLAHLVVSRSERVGAVVFSNTTAGIETLELAKRIVSKTLELHPPAPKEWRPGPPPPPEVAGLLGRWWSEGNEFVFRWREGRLEAVLGSAPAWRPPAVFREESRDSFRTVSGREHGEVLRVVRDDAGTPTKLYWATYAFTRAPTLFGES